MFCYGGDFLRERHVSAQKAHGNEKTMSVVQKIFGTHSDREIKRSNGLVDKVEGMRPGGWGVSGGEWFWG